MTSSPSTTPDRVVTRFAPSQTGFLHRGHAFSARLSHDFARSRGGRFVLRIEEIDTNRCKPEYEDAALADLAWLGLKWDDDPVRQSRRGDVYDEALRQLSERGLLRRCSRQLPDVDASVSAPHTQFAGQARVFRGAALSTMEERDQLAGGGAFAWRLSMSAVEAELGPELDRLTFIEQSGSDLMARPALVRRFDDVVLGRPDTGTTYHLSSVVDDAAQGVTHVIRGEELREAAGLHVLLCRVLDLRPPVYVHHRMIMDSTGSRLSKRSGAETLRTLRESGTSPHELTTEFHESHD